MEALVMTAQIILSLSILVGLHELGHLLAAKAFKMRVDQYSIGFPPKVFGVKYGETEYSIGAIPLGGYVKIAGMIDESLDTKALKEPPKEYEFRSKPAWQRLIVMMGGIIVNVILGVFIFICLAYIFGDNYISIQEVNRNGIYAGDIGKKIGFETGDKIVAINGQSFEKFDDVYGADVFLANNSYYTVERNGERLDLFVPSNFIDNLSEKNWQEQFIDPLALLKISEVAPGSEADRIGLQAGDVITSIQGESVRYFQDFERIKNSLANQTIQLTIERAEQPISFKANLDETAKLGFYVDRELQTTHLDYSLGGSVLVGTKDAFSTVWVNAKALGKIFTGDIDPSKSLMGPIRIATEIFGGTWNWLRFWSITGLLSMVLAFMNFLPIPALDGGHVMFLTYEIVSGRKPSDKFLETAQKFGMIILLMLMAYVIFNDIFRLEFIQNLFGK